MALFVSYGTWTSHTSTLIRTLYQSAVGVLNDTIFLLGGMGTPNQLTEYRIDTDTFINIGKKVLSDTVAGYGQFYSQQHNILYMIHPDISALSTFNLITEQYTADWIGIDIDVGDGGCLATANHQLFVVGGWTPDSEHRDALQVLDLSTNNWMNNPNPPSMNERRSYTACIAYYDHLWVFSGGTLTTTNERINITDIPSTQWTYIEPLTEASEGARAVAWHQSIFIIGGSAAAGNNLDTVHIVDVTTAQVILSEDILVYPVSTPGVTIIDNIIYAFGGTTDDDWVARDSWMKYELSFDTTYSPKLTSTTKEIPFTSKASPDEYQSSINTINDDTQYLTSAITLSPMTTKPPQYTTTNDISFTSNTANADYETSINEIKSHTQYLSVLTQFERIYHNETLINLNNNKIDKQTLQSSPMVVVVIVVALILCINCVLCIVYFLMRINQRKAERRLSQKELKHMDNVHHEDNINNQNNVKHADEESQDSDSEELYGTPGKTKQIEAIPINIEINADRSENHPQGLRNVVNELNLTIEGEQLEGGINNGVALDNKMFNINETQATDGNHSYSTSEHGTFD